MLRNSTLWPAVGLVLLGWLLYRKECNVTVLQGMHGGVHGGVHASADATLNSRFLVGPVDKQFC